MTELFYFPLIFHDALAQVSRVILYAAPALKSHCNFTVIANCAM